MSEYQSENNSKLMPYERWILGVTLVLFGVSFIATIFYKPKTNDNFVIYPTSAVQSEAQSEDTQSRISSSDLEMLLESVGKTNSNNQNNYISGKININTATAEQLTELNGIGEVKANAIIEYRNNFGNFISLEEIMNVKGIGEKTFEKIKDYITF